MSDLHRVSIDTVLIALEATPKDDGQMLKDRKVTVNENDNGTEHRTVQGYLDNLKVIAEHGRTVVVGSLPTFAYKNNAYGLTPAEVGTALQAVAGRLGISAASMEDAAVYRLDVAANLVLKEPVEEYVRTLADVPRTCRLGFTPHSLVFKTSRRELAFYDKKRQLQETKCLVPKHWKDSNVLRYELRFRRGLKAEFGQEVRVRDLVLPAFHDGLVKRWRARFHTVRCERRVRLTGARTPKELRDQLALRGVAGCGGYGGVAEAIATAKATGEITGDEANRLRQWLRRITGSAWTEPTDLEVELKRAVELAATASKP